MPLPLELERFAADVFDPALTTEERAEALKAFIETCVEGEYEDEEKAPGDEGGLALILGEPKK